jgi:DNA-binding MarR family transcriptional regulator
METVTRQPDDERDFGLSLEFHIGYWLRRVSNHVSGAFARKLSTRHTSVAEWVVLRTLHAREGTTPAELADTLGLTRGAISKILDKLEEKKWTTRKTKPQDNRVQLLSVTRQGCRVLPRLVEIADRNDREFFDCLHPEEKATLRGLLQKVADFHRIRDMPID